jgi:hypothetical protein
MAVNVQKLGASVLSMTWNFVGYRLIAFRDHTRDRSAGSP